MPALGDIFDFTPKTGGPGTRVRVSTNLPSVNLASAQEVWLQIPPNTGGSGGVTVWGFRCAFTVIDSKNLDVVIPPVGHGSPAQKVPPGHYFIVVRGGWYAGNSRGTFEVVLQTSTSPGPSPTISPLPGSVIPHSHGPVAIGTTPSTPAVTPPAIAMPPMAAPIPIGFHGVLPPFVPAINTSTTPDSSSDAEPQYEMAVRWIVERYWPLLDQTSKDVEAFRFVVSAQVLSWPERPMPDEEFFVRLLTETELGDSTRILGVSSTLAEAEKPNAKQSARTDAEGKIFFLVEVKLYRRKELPDLSRDLIGFEISQRATTSTGSDSVTSPMPGGGPPASGGVIAAPGGSGSTLLDILIDGGAPVTTPMNWLEEAMYACAALTRVKERVIGGALRVIGDFLKSKVPLPDKISVTAGGVTVDMTISEDQKRALVLGGLFGEAVGAWAAAESTVTDFYDSAKMAASVVKTFFLFIAEDPVFAAELAVIARFPAASDLVWDLDPKFRAKILSAVARGMVSVAQFAATIGPVLTFAMENPGDFVHKMADQIYKSYEDNIGFIPRDYLEHAITSAPYVTFVVAYMAGHFAAYVVGTVGIQLLLGLLTGGIVTYLSAWAKASKFALVAKLADFVKGIHAAAKAAGTAIKATAAKAFTGSMRFFGELSGDVAKALVISAERSGKPAATFFMKYSDESGDRMGAVVDAFKAVTSPDTGTRTFERLCHMADGRTPSGTKRLFDGVTLGCSTKYPVP